MQYPTMSSLRSTFQHLTNILDPDEYALLPHGTAYIPFPPYPPTPTNGPPRPAPAPQPVPDPIPPQPIPAPIPQPPSTAAASTSSVEFVSGKKGKPNAVVDGHRYTLDRRRNEKSYWRCTLRNQECCGRLVLKDDSLVTNAPTHNHGAQQVEITVHKSKQKLKTSAASSSNSSKFLAATCISTLIDHEHRTKLGCQENSLKKMARLARQKSNHHTTNPTSLEDLDIPPAYLRTHDGSNLLLWDSGYSTNLRRSYLFGTDDKISILQSSQNLVIDGTFKTAPNLFTQLLTVHSILDDGWRIPCAYGLLPGKREVLYSNLLQQLDDIADISPDTVLTDYELGLRNAVRSIWPGATLRGCYFHFTQCLWRRFTQSDLVPEYQVPGSDVRKAFKMVGALPFVPLGDVEMAWRHLKI